MRSSCERRRLFKGRRRCRNFSGNTQKPIIHLPNCETSISNSGRGKPKKIETAPFYIFLATAALIGTYCGLVINEKGQVIDVFGNKINHLYAAGEIMGGLHGAAYMTGTALGKALSFGRIAARNIAKEA